MRRIGLLVVAMATLTIAITPLLASAHGTERHYGDPFGKRGGSPPSVDFSLLLVEISFKSLRRELELEDGLMVERRAERARRATLNLLRATAEAEDRAGPFAEFGQVLNRRAPTLVAASRERRWAAALSDLRALETSFRDAKLEFEGSAD